MGLSTWPTNAVEGLGFRVCSLVSSQTLRVGLETAFGCLQQKIGLKATWTLKVCRIMALMAIIVSLGLLYYILLGFR